MPLYGSIHVRTISGWRAAAAAGLVLVLLAALAFLAFGVFLVLLPVAALAGLVSIFLPRKRRSHRGNDGIIEADYRVISEERTNRDDRVPTPHEGDPKS